MDPSIVAYCMLAGANSPQKSSHFWTCYGLLRKEFFNPDTGESRFVCKVSCGKCSSFGRSGSHKLGVRPEKGGDSRPDRFSIYPREFVDLIWRALQAEDVRVGKHGANPAATRDGNADECFSCHKGGNLICCGGCATAWHAPCLTKSGTPAPAYLNGKQGGEACAVCRGKGHGCEWYCAQCVARRREA